MGSLQAREMAELADLDTALRWHLQANHYPPIPLTMLDPCKQAIDAMNEGDIYRQIELPVGVYYKGETAAPAWDVVSQHHLDAWIEYDEF